MLRIVVENCDAAMAANVGGTVHKTIKTFDVDLPELEAHLIKHNEYQYDHSQVVGVEILKSEGGDSEATE